MGQTNSKSKDPTSTKCADEGDTCKFNGTKNVKYGADTRWTTKTFTDKTACNNKIFGDPAPGAHKACYLESDVAPEPTPTQTPTPSPVDCQVSAWTKGDCSGTQRKYTRTITQQPANNGLPCPTDMDKMEADSTCNPPVDCQVSDWIKGDCSGTKRKYTRTITRQPANNGLPCPANMDKMEADSTCTPPPQPVDCKLSAWVPGSCFAGQRHSTRTILVNPQNGGQACGLLEKTETDPTCNAPAASNANNNASGTAPPSTTTTTVASTPSSETIPIATAETIATGTTDYTLWYVGSSIYSCCYCLLILAIILFLLLR